MDEKVKPWFAFFFVHAFHVLILFFFKRKQTFNVYTKIKTQQKSPYALPKKEDAKNI